MSATAAPSAPAAESLLERHHFLLRRLHSLTGIAPIGVFVMFHLFTNMQMIFEGAFQHEVEFIHSMPALLFLEIFGLWLPIGFHAALGFVYTFSGRPNNNAYKYADNWRYTLQRVTGILAFIFIFIHIATLRWHWTFGVLDTPFYLHGPNGEPLAHASTALALQPHWLVVVLYAVGVMSAVYHWSNGLWTAAITWGLTISVAAQRRFGYVCAALFVALTIFTVAAIRGAVGYEPTEHELAAMAQLKAGQPAAHVSDAAESPSH